MGVNCFQDYTNCVWTERDKGQLSVRLKGFVVGNAVCIADNVRQSGRIMHRNMVGQIVRFK